MTPLSDLVRTSATVGTTSARLGKVRAIAAHLRALDVDEIAIAAQYLSGSAPQGRFGIGYSVLRKASDGEPAVEPTLTILETDRRLGEIAVMRGSGASALRADALRTLLALASEAEREFLVQLLAGELRQGALEGVMVDAIAAAAELPPAPVRRAMMYAKSVGAVAKSALVDGEAGLATFALEILSPIAPMLAQTAADPADALRQLGGGEAVFEWKMDGARIQAHKSGDVVRLYTRNLNDVSASIPEIVDAVRALTVSDVILDGEAIAFDANGRPYPFQITMRRFGRRLDVDALRAELPMRAFFFDCLRLEGQSLVDRPLRERHAALADAVPEALRIPRIVTASADEAQAFYDAAIAAAHEGVMAKSLDAPYEAGNRGAGWLKIKRAHTLDLVVIAAEWGHGRRTGKLSNLHLGALEPGTGEYVMLGKTFKGLTDAMLEWQTKALLAREVRSDGYTVYVRPELVAEIAFSDLQASPRYPGGLALRLARVKRYRDDKRVEEADTMDSVRRIAAAQG